MGVIVEIEIMTNHKIPWPEGKDFAFTVFDDTDRAIVNNVSAVYSFLSDCGFKTTKSVWPVRGNQNATIDGSTCEDSVYLRWLYELEKLGFEIGYHNTTFHSSKREDTIIGINKFKELFGYSPKSHANHLDCQESIYWGSYRLTGINRFIYNVLTMKHHKGLFQGHIEESEYFWGDICKENIKYVRNFVYDEINTLKACPIMPYHDKKRPYVNYWFASSEGADLDAFVRCINEKNQDSLEKEHGACIMYTHFASGFYKDGKLDARFEGLMKRLSQKNGWFVPISTLLDYLMDKNGHHEITDQERNRLEKRWLLHKIRVGRT